MALKPLLMSSLVGLAAYASPMSKAASHASKRQAVILGGGVQGDFASFSMGWSACATGPIVQLSSGAYLAYQSDGNLVMYTPGAPGAGYNWDSGYSDPSLPCASPCNCQIVFQTDGNLVAYINYGQANQFYTWASYTTGVSRNYGLPAKYFNVLGFTEDQYDFPYIAIVDAGGNPFWSNEIMIPGSPPVCVPGQTAQDCFPGVPVTGG
ncbi:hypothetical protein F5Y03DRAFT_377919 [Xylaria venustula]|nr:hypothetical protein F5Y03DRAFT_377919 [Xylaria venustula]